ncbi:MAG: hypothetical protein ABIJ34_01995 [archaeon]
MDSIILIIASILAAVSTQLVSIKFNQGPVKASALLSFIVALIFFFIKIPLSGTIPLAFIGGSFVGMSSKVRLPNYLLTAFGGFVFGIIFVNSSKIFAGFGGGLGTTACLSVIIAIGMISFFTHQDGSLTGPA